MNQLYRITAVTTFALTAAACGVEAPDTVESVATADQALAHAAEVLAPALESPTLRGELQRRLAEKVTGDFEVFLDTILDVRLEDGRTVGEIVEPTGILDYPSVHLATPGGVPDLEGAASVRTTFVPRGQEPTTLTMYDARGGREDVAAEVSPEGPVVVLAMNERMGARGLGVMDSGGVAQTSRALWGSYTVSYLTVRLRSLMIFTTSEPWYKGDPEIYVVCLSNPYQNPRLSQSTSVARLDLPHVNKVKKSYSLNHSLVTYVRNTSTPPTCWVMEQDGGVGNIVLGDADDILGGITLNANYSTTTRHVLEDAEIRLAPVSTWRW